jgi:EAL domain-containing protein (putative c-di-GMP-specific phosphodiesterase class I)
MPNRIGAKAMPEGRALRFLLAVALMNGLICIIAPAMVVSRPGGAREAVGSVVYLAAVAVLALTPIQFFALWLVLGGRIRDQHAVRQTKIRIEQTIRDQQMGIAFQPIVDICSGRVIGVEALARFSAEPVAAPDVWFADADRVGQGPTLELMALEIALSRVAELPPDLYVSLNVSPSTLSSRQVVPVLLDSAVCLNRIVLEITEHASVVDYPSLVAARAELGVHGIRLAVDDAGSGYASFQHIVALAPDIIKIDRSLVAGIDHDQARQALVAAVVMFALHAGTTVLGEGVETAAELDALTSLGVDSAQGYFLGRPSMRPDVWQSWQSPAGDRRPASPLTGQLNGAPSHRTSPDRRPAQAGLGVLAVVEGPL